MGYSQLWENWDSRGSTGAGFSAIWAGMWILIGSWQPIAGLFVAMLAMLELGRVVGRNRQRADPDGSSRGTGALESTILALLGLLLAFTFSGAWSRFEARRALILKETNIIGTAWLRLDLLPEPGRARLQDSFRRYVELRLESTQHVDTKPPATLAAVQQTIWSDAVAVSRFASDARAAQLLLPALNEMFDVAGERYVAVTEHPPALVFMMLLVFMLLAALLAGYAMAAGKHRHWLHVGCFVVGLLFALYVTIDLEYPRAGLIRVDSYDQLLIDLRAEMK